MLKNDRVVWAKKEGEIVTANKSVPDQAVHGFLEYSTPETHAFTQRKTNASIYR